MKGVGRDLECQWPSAGLLADDANHQTSIEFKIAIRGWFIGEDYFRKHLLTAKKWIYQIFLGSIEIQKDARMWFISSTLFCVLVSDETRNYPTQSETSNHSHVSAIANVKLLLRQAVPFISPVRLILFSFSFINFHPSKKETFAASLTERKDYKKNDK